MRSLFLTTALAASTLAVGGNAGKLSKPPGAGKPKIKDVSDACAALSTTLPDQVAFPNTTSYDLSSIYWSTRQTALHPACFLTPNSTASVSTALGFLTANSIPFAVKAGGHTAFPGSNIDSSGITIDLRLLNTITVSPDRRTVSVGPGNHWINITTVLDPLGLAVVGGRSADPGVGGLTLGGGISYFSGLRGWVCDNVLAYEIVLASGSILTASPTSNPDLYWSLRGGAATNLGIVTRFDLASFEQGPLWANTLLFDGSYNTTLIPLFQNLTVAGLPADPGAHTYFGFVRLPTWENHLIYSDQFHAMPASNNANVVPDAFAPFADIPAVVRHQRMSNLTSLLQAIQQPYGQRQTWMNVAVKGTSAALLQDILPLHERHEERMRGATSGTTGVASYLTFQPISVNVLDAMQVNGGNALGLSRDDGPLVIVQSATAWDSESLDLVVGSSTRVFIQDVEDVAKKRGLDHGFVYMNYAETTQDVFARYGSDNLKRLRKVAKKYDPNGALQKLWKGYFKLW
ncbi:hypothetical protein QBC34DRAFT_357681 [Podospora aff. communis PSN243]|uniref:FAD-binding PCMH-type domain-containing protein n=1 Tax=Podospora aff. communis PSN243 TaxID=3040156 RepID=A0AAV9GC57_9PEZI|nr:hypothetical protein QBC34DRAFT_357681 [Podospora aff. communis PSN243]